MQYKVLHLSQRASVFLSEKDLIVLNEALERLQFLKRKKGKTNEQIRQEIAKVVGLLIEFFAKDQN
jgi:hypothetical protein